MTHKLAKNAAKIKRKLVKQKLTGDQQKEVEQIVQILAQGESQKENEASNISTRHQQKERTR